MQFQVEGNIAQAGNPNNQGSSLFFGFIAAAIVLFIAFGSFVAMLLPLLTAGVSLGCGIAVVGLLSHVIGIATFSNELALLIGLGVGVDYALFIVTRYRQAMLRGASREDAVVEAIDTSGRAVLFAGLIVVIAMLGMFVLGVSFLYGVAVAASVTVAFTVISALTLLPAMLAVSGKMVLRRKERRAVREGTRRLNDESPAWARWTAIMNRRPAAFALVAALVMIVIALPFFGMRLGSADAGTDPSSATTRKAYDLLAKGFGPGYNGPLELVARIDNPSQLAAFTKAEQAVAHTPGVVGSTPVRYIKGTGGRPSVAIAQVYPKGSPQAASTSDLLHHIRGSVIPAATRGSGVRVSRRWHDGDLRRLQPRAVEQAAAVHRDRRRAQLPAADGGVPQPGDPAHRGDHEPAVGGRRLRGADRRVPARLGRSIIGLNTTGPIEAFLPVLLFPILFGLSMDYEVFLISRIYEEWHRRGNNTEAVTHGLSATGRTITAAASIMVLVFGSFVLGGQWIIEMFGVGLASAVLLDALIVRSVLVPSLMILLGDANWKIPGWLDRLLPQFNVEGSAQRELVEDGGGRRGAPEPATG